MRNLAGPLVLGVILTVSAAAEAEPVSEKRSIINNYADIAQAIYEDSLDTARKLQKAITAFLAKPNAAHLKAARQAWLAAREPYQTSETYRFGNPIVDDWEGKVNAWPLDEGLIDYVDPSYGKASDANPLFTTNVIANKKFAYAGQTVDASKITKELLAETLHEIGKVEANVATGYHAVEFLLWGQDLNGTGPGAGDRPWTDYAKGRACTHGNCDRRGQYLKVATDLLVGDLGWMAAQWAPGGSARKQLADGGEDEGLAAMLAGMGSLSYGELAGERMKLGLLLHDPEEEHDCFSDNTHNSHYRDVVGIRAVYVGEYQRVSGKPVKGPSLSQLVAKIDPALDGELRAKLDKTVGALAALKKRAETVEAYDQMIGKDNKAGNAAVQAAIDALTEQTKSIERVVAALKLQPIRFEGSESLDDPAKVFK
ncbi:MAG: peptidase [Alphaproteobacteria bacterium]|nr:peptidase [Alphaproteobacteria bacterium]